MQSARPRLPSSRLRIIALAGVLAGATGIALGGGCCDHPPNDGHDPPCATPPCPFPLPAGCPSIAEIAAGASIPPVEKCGLPVWICALQADIAVVTATPTFVGEATYRERWAAHVEKGWLALTKHLHDQATAYPEIKSGASSLEATITTLTVTESDRKKLVDRGYWRDDARMLWDGATGTPGLAPPCPRP